VRRCNSPDVARLSSLTHSDRIGGDKTRLVTTIRLLGSVLRDFGDHGADTFQRYFAQFEYTAFWCIRMLRPAEGITAVMPEWVEDVVIEREDGYELHQVKTRDKGSGPWTLADVLPILCQQYHRRMAFTRRCRFHFVSNGVADTRSRSKPYTVTLFSLKRLLEARQQSAALTEAEQAAYKQFENDVLPIFAKHMRNEHNEDLSADDVLALILNTVVETASERLRYPLAVDGFSPDNLEELSWALEDGGDLSHHQLLRIYERLLLLILRKVLDTSRSRRRIESAEVLACRSAHVPNAPDARLIDDAPGNSLLEKKMFLGGFSPAEIKQARRNRWLTEGRWRELVALGLEGRLEWFCAELVESQQQAHDRICRVEGLTAAPGPRVLAAVRSVLAQVAESHFSDVSLVNQHFSLGVLWRETDRCFARWHTEPTPHGDG
jgi:hypothetical protein